MGARHSYRDGVSWAEIKNGLIDNLRGGHQVGGNPAVAHIPGTKS